MCLCKFKTIFFYIVHDECKDSNFYSLRSWCRSLDLKYFKKANKILIYNIMIKSQEGPNRVQALFAYLDAMNEITGIVD